MTSPAGIEVFADYPAATVTGSLNSTDSTDTLSVSWLTGITWPAASTSVSPSTYFRISDPAAPSEIMLVTVAAGGAGPVSSQSWTVTRGYEGTPKVTHAAGFTIQQIVSAGTLQNFKQAVGAQSGTSLSVSNNANPVVVATYQPQSFDVAAGSAWEAIAFGTFGKLGGARTVTLAWALYWGGSGSVGGTYAPGTLLASCSPAVSGNEFLTTVATGSTFDANGTLALVSATSAVANINFFWSTAATTGSGQVCGSSASAVTISGNGPIFLVATWSSASASYSYTAVAPLIYRVA